MSEDRKTPLLEVKNIKKWFPAKKSPFSREKVYIKAVDGVSFTLNEGETLGVVGESGCGKSTMGRTVLRLIEPTEGQVLFEGKDYTALKDAELRKSRTDLQIIFQDPYASLDPRMTIGDIIAEPLDIQLKLPAKERMERVLKTMERVGLNTRYVNRYPHEFSGGQRQRIGIARAIVLEPKLMVCDEPVSALDVSIQAQVLNLLMDLQKEMKMAYIFISHDLSVIKHISDRVAVMYLGHVVEIAEKADLYDHPMHPYTVALLSAIPVPDRKHKKEKIVLEGDLPSPANPPSGCIFHTRCYKAKDICKTQVPELKDCGNGHCCACHFPE
ncbi:ABC transporter ATP-binding protein [Frisingicoccus sp.]|uniref:ABC transporter ATP-binding protein n=1 Tax=Frisingicoccus sp. TaxID=1918627 RepID=UPI00261D176D|nr:dipeptide ABC transporter ATP-binding protein [Frisingicoccus sp.]MDD6231973.1 dipeptide ABC transporter ATP-binding protein [Frisingicoccus sp.]MDY4834936.1 dipeptide ABC transporter ATP-binding protein [Frisingicoccus sp.]MDY4922083.1 dipeptide ABC transporter ATP-binding protein [Frisingicoccus sp.]